MVFAYIFTLSLALGATSTQLIPLLIQLSQTLQLAPGISPLARVEAAMVILSEFFGGTYSRVGTLFCRD